MKVIGFRKPYLLILSIWLASPRSGYIDFFKMEISIFLSYILVADLESFSKYYNKISFD